MLGDTLCHPSGQRDTNTHFSLISRGRDNEPMREATGGNIMRADRLLALVMRLQVDGKKTSYDLAQELGVSRRTILRDIDALSTAGIPIYSDGGHGGGVALDENYRVTLTGLKESEIRSLFI